MKYERFYIRLTEIIEPSLLIAHSIKYKIYRKITYKDFATYSVRERTAGPVGLFFGRGLTRRHFIGWPSNCRLW